jgi:hypothetical protein
MNIQNFYPEMQGHILRQDEDKVVQFINQHHPNGVDSKIDAQGRSMLEFAVMHARLDISELLLNCGASTICVGPVGWVVYNSTLMHHAARNNDVDITKLLLRNGLHKNAQELRFPTDLGGKTPLFLAAQLGNTELAYYLINQHADVCLSDRFLHGPAWCAADANDTDMMKKLLTGDINVLKAIDFEGNSLLHKACIENNIEACRLLVYWIDPLVRNLMQQDCIMMADSHESFEVSLFLRRYVRERGTKTSPAA